MYLGIQMKSSYNVDIEIYSNDREGLLADIIKNWNSGKSTINGCELKSNKRKNSNYRTYNRSK